MKHTNFFLKVPFFLVMGCASSFTLADSAVCTVSTDGKTNTCNGAKAVYDQYRLNYDNVIITNTAWRFTVANGVEGIGLYANGSQFNANNLTVSTTNGLLGGTDAIRTNGTSTITVNGKLIVNASGFSGDGINVSITSNATVNTGNNSEISSNSGVAVRANLSSYGHNQINIGDNAIIKSAATGTNGSSSQGYALYAGSRDTEAVSMPTGTAKIVVGENSNISTSGNNGYAVYANKTGQIQLGNNAIIQTTGSGAHGIVAQDGDITFNNTTTSYAGGVVDLLGDTAINVDSTKGSNAIYSSGQGSVVSSYDTSTSTQKSGKFNVVGDMLVDRGGKIDLRMTDNSSFIGNTAITGNNGTLNLDISGANSRWQMSKSSQVTDLNLKDNASIVLGDQSTAVDNTNRVVLTAANLSGNGQFLMRTNIIGSGLGADNIGDLLQVTGTSQGDHLVTVSDFYNGSAVVDGTERLKIIETSDGSANFALNGTSKSVDIGAYKYYLDKGDAKFSEDNNHWYLGTNPSKELNNTADRSANILNINYLLNYAETQTLLHRMGELHQPRDKDWDFWIRGFTGKMSSFSGKLSGFDLDYSGVQAGLDKHFQVNGDDFYAGIMAGTSQAKADYDVGHGNTESYHIGVYGTYKTQNDFYVDAIAKYTLMKNDFNTQTGAGYQVKGDGTTRGYTLGLETGKRFYLERASKSGWYIEPQAQLTYSHQDSAKIHSNNGLKTKLEDFDSVLGRASAIVGYNLNQGKTPVDVYLKTGYVKEFDGKTGYSFNGNANTRNKYQFDGSWWDNGIGINVNINQQHNIYAEADYAKGSKFDNKSIKVGYRLAF